MVGGGDGGSREERAVGACDDLRGGLTDAVIDGGRVRQFGRAD